MNRVPVDIPYSLSPSMEEIDDFYVVNVVTATPYKIMLSELAGKEIALMIYLCRDTSERLFMINHAMYIENDEDRERIKDLPFSDDKDFVSSKVAVRELNTYLDRYITDMKFYLFTELTPDAINSNKSNEVYFYGRRLGSPSDVYKFIIPINIYSTMSFIDSCVYNRTETEHDIALATLSSSKELSSSMSFFYATDIESIESMASADITRTYSWFERFKLRFSKEERDPVTTIGLVFKTSREEKDCKEVATILIPFDVSVEFDESKYRGKTITDIQNEFFKDSDQYVSTFSVDKSILYYRNKEKNIIESKEFMIIRGKTKDKMYYLFLLDSSMQNKLLEKINEY
jgi:hypothetical protein